MKDFQSLVPIAYRHSHLILLQCAWIKAGITLQCRAILNSVVIALGWKICFYLTLCLIYYLKFHLTNSNWFLWLHLIITFMKAFKTSLYNEWKHNSHNGGQIWNPSSHRWCLFYLAEYFSSVQHSEINHWFKCCDLSKKSAKNCHQSLGNYWR